MIPDFNQVGQAQQQSWQPEQNVPAVVFNNVNKNYGRIYALSGINLAISGGVTGVLGLNGAGKSTLFNILIGKIKPTSGDVRLFGTNPWKNPSPYAKVGFVPEHEKMHDWMTAFDFLVTFARIHGMTRSEAEVEANRVLEFVNLADVAHKEIGKFSKGMRQRVKIAHALVNDPQLIILDEPLQGCDPLARTTIMNVIRELGRMGRTVLVSSHILHEIERITEQIVLLHKGQILAIGNMHAIREKLDSVPHKISIGCPNPKSLAKDVIQLDGVYGVTLPNKDSLEIHTHHFGLIHDLLPSVIVNGKHEVHTIDNPDDDLESVIGYLTGGF